MKSVPQNLYGRRPSPFVTVPLVVLLLVAGGATGYLLLGRAQNQDWSWFDCVYFTVITLTTVGYGELLPNLEHDPTARAYTIVLLLAGYGVMVWAFSTMVALLVEGRFTELLGRRRMMAQIAEMRGHYILCGIGETGIHVYEELVRTHRPVVVVERNLDRITAISCDGDMRFVEGDAEDDDVLRKAGIEQAAGLIACLPDDKDNIYLVLSARQLNPRLRVAARSIHMESQEKLRRAGADVVVSPNYNGGMRLASEMIRPHVTSFLDIMLRDQSQVIRLADVEIPEGSWVDGRTIHDADIHRQTSLLVIATRVPNDDGFFYNPGPDYVLRAGMVLIVLGNVANVEKLQALVAGAEQPERTPVAP